MISKASGSKADVLIEPGDKIQFGNLFLEVGMQVLVVRRAYIVCDGLNVTSQLLFCSRFGKHLVHFHLWIGSVKNKQRLTPDCTV